MIVLNEEQLHLSSKLDQIKSLTYFDKELNKEVKVSLTDKRKEALSNLGLLSVSDVIFHFPRRYEFNEVTPLQDGEVLIQGKVNSIVKVSFIKSKMSRSNFELLYQNQIVKVVFFNQYFLKKQIEASQNIFVKGKYDSKTNTIVMSSLHIPEENQLKKVDVIYSLRKQLTSSVFSEILKGCLYNTYKQLHDFIPSEYSEKYQLLPLNQAVSLAHFPKNKEQLNKAQRSIIYDEFFKYFIHEALEKKALLNEKGYHKNIDTNDLTSFASTLHYELTDQQKKVLNEIYLDLKSEHPMNRILLADVGSGKTLVALVSVYMVFMSGYQSAFIAPTTILATQHYYEALKVFKDCELRVELLTSATHPKEREAILEDLRKGKIDLLIGTHSIFQEDVSYKNLGFIIIDEQQRFGVKQRKLLKEKGEYVDSLMLSATPIPRTLAQSLYSSLDISTIDKPLPFKKPIQSTYLQSKSLKPYLPQMIELLEKNQQVYIVTPLVEDNENENASAIDIYQNMSNYFKDKYKVGLLYGGMKPHDKDQVMIDFAQGNYDILVSTSVIEVGVSVPNANCMIIYDAERFGLSQLHQLRGRVGRGQEQGYCLFLSNSDDPNAIEKLNYIASTNNGFEIAQYDLESRGPGDLLGTSQSGLPSFHLGDMFKHKKIFEIAQADANNFVFNNNHFETWYNKHKHYLDNLEFFKEV